MPPKKIAALNTIYHQYSHAQHIVDRFLEGYGWQGRHHTPEVQIASMYVDQTDERDLSQDRSERFGVPVYPTIAEALTLGGETLAVDGVLIIGEHGQYERNEKGQHLYPRYQFFMETVGVFRDSGRAVPVFNDKHLSYDWNQAVEMVDISRELGFAFMAGSSLPVTWRLPALEFPLGVEMREALCACYGGVDSYDFHGLETAQCMVERRGDGEVGVQSLHALRGRSGLERDGERRVRPRAADGGGRPQLHPTAPPRRQLRHRLPKRPPPGGLPRPDRLSDGASGRAENDDDPVERFSSGLQLCRPFGRRVDSVDADVSADAARAHHLGELL